MDTATESLASTNAAADRDFVASRTFDASRDLVFKAWTEPDRLKQWFGPKGCPVVSCTNDLCAGGSMHYAMTLPDGSAMWGKWVHREITEPSRLVFVASFSDEAGGVTRHPFSAGWPLEMLSIVTFDESDGGTLVTIRASAHNATELERETFQTGLDGMQQGWNGTFEQLAAHVEAGER